MYFTDLSVDFYAKLVSKGKMVFHQHNYFYYIWVKSIHFIFHPEKINTWKNI